MDRYPASATKIGNSNCICREDLIGKDVTLTMAAAAEGKGAVGSVKANLPGKKSEEVYALHFAETPKTLVLNSTNKKALQRMFGNKTADWVGKRITLYFKPDVRCPDGSKGGTRIREVADEPKHDATTGEVKEDPNSYGPPPMEPEKDGDK